MEPGRGDPMQSAVCLQPFLCSVFHLPPSAVLSADLAWLEGDGNFASPRCSGCSLGAAQPMSESLVSQKEAHMGYDISKVTAEMIGRNGSGTSEFPGPDL